ncbi:MAG: DUF421 domain-containing protein [Clostridia bacterium]|nr:DUF421 domain-containing protein [Clostridia bacterium]
MDKIITIPSLRRRYFFHLFTKAINGDAMLISLVRALILYILIFFCMRLMGKRQLGELQPTELVITILVSAIAAVPMQDNALPLGNSIVAVLLLVSLEIINSSIVLKSSKWRSFFEGNSIVIIRDGVIDQKQLKKLRFSVDDLLDQLRQKDVFDINDVQYAIIETNGQLSVMLKPEKEPVTAEMIDINNFEKGLLCLVINDGEILKRTFEECNMNEKKLNKILSENKIKAEDVFFMLADKKGNVTIVRKEAEK